MIERLETKRSAKSLASEAGYSVAHYYRKHKRPVEQLRRLCLERSAYELTRTEREVAEIGFRAGFKSAEGFTRAFRRAYGVVPSKFRRLGVTEYRLRINEPIHFAPSETLDDPRQGEFSMNVIDRLIGAHYEGMKLILDRCETLTPEQLDQPVRGYFDPLPWMSQNQTLRSLLQLTTGSEDLPSDGQSVDNFRACLEKSYARLKEEIATHEKEQTWDLTFVDSACEPPMVFSYGGWIGHVLVFLTHRRIACIMALRDLGVQEIKFFDPIDFSGERAVQPIAAS